MARKTCTTHSTALRACARLQHAGGRGGRCRPSFFPPFVLGSRWRTRTSRLNACVPRCFTTSCCHERVPAVAYRRTSGRRFKKKAHTHPKNTKCRFACLQHFSVSTSGRCFRAAPLPDARTTRLNQFSKRVCVVLILFSVPSQNIVTARQMQRRRIATHGRGGELAEQRDGTVVLE